MSAPDPQIDRSPKRDPVIFMGVPLRMIGIGDSIHSAVIALLGWVIVGYGGVVYRGYVEFDPGMLAVVFAALQLHAMGFDGLKYPLQTLGMLFVLCVAAAVFNLWLDPAGWNL